MTDDHAAPPRAIDLDVCPHCGRRDFRLVSEERVYGYLGILLGRGPDGEPVASWYGATHCNWDSGVTTAYLCLDCERVLPEWYAAALDRLLANTRRRDLVSGDYASVPEGEHDHGAA